MEILNSKRMLSKKFSLLLFVLLTFSIIISHPTSRIDRKSLVNRHNITITSFDSLPSLTVGNCEFAFTVDATGLQTFSEFYNNGVPLDTQSQCGRHSFLNTNGYKYEETFREYNFNGRNQT